MRLLAVTLLFVTALTAQRGMGGFGRHSGFHAPVGHGRSMGGGFRGFHPPARPSHGFIGGRHYRGGFGYGRSVYGGAWGGWGGFSYVPFGWYSAPLWTVPAAYPAWNPYPYNTGPTVIIVAPATTEPSGAVVERNSLPPYRPPAAPEPAPETVENRALATQSWAYLIASKDGTIWLAREYRVERGVLHFTIKGDNWKRLPLADVDVARTEQLNRERGVAVDLR